MVDKNTSLLSREPEQTGSIKLKIHKNLNIILISTAIVLSSFIISGVIYAVQIQKQQSIEKQQKLELEQEKKLSEEKAKATAEAQDKEYKSQRRNDCYDIYNDERKAYSNVLHVNYWEFNDTCVITYSDTDGSTFTKNF